MIGSDKTAFGEMLGALYDMHGKSFSPAALMLWWRALEGYAFDDIQGALQQLVDTSEFLPKPAGVIELIDPHQWPTAAEAWAIYPHDERITGAVCDATQAAWASADALWEGGDTIGARRAFEGAYTRHMEAAKARGLRRPAWRLSIGWDASLREQGAHEALKLGLLRREQVQGYLGHGERQEQIERHVPERRRGVQPVGRLVGRAVADGAEGDVSEGVGPVARRGEA